MKKKRNGASWDLRYCKVDITNNTKALISFMDSVVKLVKMVKLGPIVIRKDSGKKPGVTVIQVIETSHIALHGFTKKVRYMFSIESCKDFDAVILKKFIKNYFKPKYMHKNALYSIPK